MDPKELRSAIEAILFVATEPVKAGDLAETLDEKEADVTAQLDELKKVLDENVGGFALEQTAGGWRFATRAEHDSVLKKYFAKKGENRLSLAALETLAITAYRQPVTAPEISDIRDLPRLEEFGDLIGEAMSDDLVAAISSAEPTPASEVQEISAEETERAEAEALAELESAERSERSAEELESSRGSE